MPVLFTLRVRVKKDYISWDYAYLVVSRGLWRIATCRSRLFFGRTTPIPLKRRIIHSLRPLQSRLIEWNPGGRSSLRIQVSYTNDRPRMTVFLPGLHTWRNVVLPSLLLWISVEKQPIMVSIFLLSFMWAKIKKAARDIPLKYVVELNGFNSKSFPVLLMI